MASGSGAARRRGSAAYHPQWARCPAQAHFHDLKRVMVTTNAISPRRQTDYPKSPKIENRQGSAINYAVRLIHAVCGLAGPPTLIDEIRADVRADNVRAAIADPPTGPVFDWLKPAFR